MVAVLSCTTISSTKIFRYLCDKQGLIGREMFAIDGVKLPSNASKVRSGTRADFERQAGKLEAAAQTMLARHRERDALPTEPGVSQSWSPICQPPRSNTVASPPRSIICFRALPDG
jgi:hypothetical protein